MRITFSRFTTKYVTRTRKNSLHTENNKKCFTFVVRLLYRQWILYKHSKDVGPLKAWLWPRSLSQNILSIEKFSILFCIFLDLHLLFTWRICNIIVLFWWRHDPHQHYFTRHDIHTPPYSRVCVLYLCCCKLEAVEKWSELLFYFVSCKSMYDHHITIAIDHVMMIISCQVIKERHITKKYLLDIFYSEIYRETAANHSIMWRFMYIWNGKDMVYIKY